MNILIVDDEASQRSILSGYLKKKRHVIYEADSVAHAIERFAASPVDVILTDFQMPHGTGLDLLKAAKDIHSQAAVIIMTAFGTIEGAVTAMREGAFDYLTKPINLDELDMLLRRVDELHQLKSENQILREQLAEKNSFTGIISQSDAMEGVLSSAVRVAQSSASVLIRGESGVGKELIAKAIHFASDRKDRAFIKRGWPVGRARKAVVAFGAIGMLMLIPTVFMSNLFALAGSFAIATFAYATFCTMVLVFPSDLYQSNSVATVSGLSGTAAGILTVLSTFLVGWIADHYTFTPILIAASTVPLIGAILVFILIRNTKHSGKGVLLRI
ncbi:MAG: response regulator [Ignavibacteria bacterium]|nr:response regulator [Ignavibacteria bacterium]